MLILCNLQFIPSSNYLCKVNLSTSWGHNSFVRYLLFSNCKSEYNKRKKDSFPSHVLYALFHIIFDDCLLPTQIQYHICWYSVTDITGQTAVTSSRVKQSKRNSWWTPLHQKMESTDSPETSVTNYQPTPRTIPNSEGFNYTAEEVLNFALIILLPRLATTDWRVRG
jgi:hypothetical protein